MDKQGNTLINIVQNFVSDETIICVDRDPSWINKEIKKIIEQKKQFYKQFIRSNKTLLYINQFKALYDKLGFLVEKSKSNYYSKLSRYLTKLLALKLTGQY